MKLAWLTDIHLNFLLSRKWFIDYYNKIKIIKSDGIIITGDIGECGDLPRYINDMIDNLNIPIYFVLGNHDFYMGTIETSRYEAKFISESSELINWLPFTGIVKLSKRVCLIGHDSWYDCRNGDFKNTPVQMNDFNYITNFKDLSKYKTLSLNQKLADEATDFIRNKIDEVIELKYEKIVIALHIPPFIEASWHNEGISNDNYLPFYSTKVMGDMLLEKAKENSEINFLVLCGHTHSKGETDVLPNLKVLTGGAQYYYPEVQGIIEIDDFNCKFKPINKILYEDIENCWGKEQLNYEIETGSKEKGACCKREK